MGRWLDKLNGAASSHGISNMPSSMHPTGGGHHVGADYDSFLHNRSAAATMSSKYDPASIHSYSNTMQRHSANHSTYTTTKNTITLNKIFADLSSKFSDVRRKAALDLRHFIESEVRDNQLVGGGINSNGSGDDFSGSFIDPLSKKLCDLVLSSDGHTQLGGIVAIVELIDARTDANETMCIRFANIFRLLFKQLSISTIGYQISKHQNPRRISTASSRGQLLSSATHSAVLDQLVIESAAAALGSLARHGGMLSVDIVDFYAKQSIEWLQDPSDHHEHRHLLAVHILKQLALNTPTLFNVYIQSFLDVIQIALRDSRLEVRVGAVGALRVCMTDVTRRNVRWRQQCYDQLMQSIIELQAAKGLSSVPVPVIHGSLLVLGELLSNSGDYLAGRFDEVATLLLAHKHHSNPLIVRTVISLIPRLAAVDCRRFTELYLHSCLTHLIDCMSSSATRDVAFIAVGELSLAVNEQILPVLELIVQHVIKGLAPIQPGRAAQQPASLGAGPATLSINTIVGVRRDAQLMRNRLRATNTALSCIGMLSRALGDKLLPHSNRLIDAMFNVGLTGPLIDALIEVTTSIPQLLPNVQERLLHAIAALLVHHLPQHAPATTSAVNAVANKHYQSVHDSHNTRKQLGSSVIPVPTIRAPMALPAAAQAKRQQQHQSPSDATHQLHAADPSSLPHTRQQDVEHSQLVLALKTLSTFNFANQSTILTGFLSSVVVRYLEHEYPIVRREASLTCCKLLPIIVRGIREHGQSTESVLVFNVLKKLLDVAIADPVASIRLSVLTSLDPALDKYLCHIEVLQSMFVSLNDETFAIREVGLHLLGRLSLRNPAAVLPVVRRTLVHLLSQLQQFDSDSVDLEESARLLGHVIVACQQLVRPYVPAVLHVLIPKLTQYHPNNTMSVGVSAGVASGVLSTIGKLALICSEEMIGHADQLIPLIISSLTDRASPIKRQVAVRVLGEVLSSIGYAIDVPAPLKYPTLLPTLLSLLKTERTSTLRVEVLKVIGIIGALDPVQYRHILYIDKPMKDGQYDKRDGVCGAVYRYSETDVQSSLALANDPFTISTSDEYYPTIALESLIKCLDGGLGGIQISSSQMNLYPLILKAMMFIIRGLNQKCVPFLPTLIPLFLQQIQRFDDPMRLMLFAQLAIITNIVKQHIRSYLEPILDSCLMYWYHTSLLPGILTLIEELAVVLRDEFQNHLVRIIPKMIHILNTNNVQTDHQPTIRVLRSIRIISTKGTLDEYLHVIIPALVAIVQEDSTQRGEHLSSDAFNSHNESTDTYLRSQRDAIRTLGRVARHHDISEHSSRIIQCFVRILQMETYPFHNTTNISGLQEEVLSVLCILIQQLGQSYMIYEPLITKTLLYHAQTMHQSTVLQSHYYRRYTRLVQRLQHSNSSGTINQLAYKDHLNQVRVNSNGTAEMVVNIGGKAVELTAEDEIDAYEFSHSAGIDGSAPDYQPLSKLSNPFNLSALDLTRTSSADSDSETDLPAGVGANALANDPAGGQPAADAAGGTSAARKLAVSQSQLMRAWSSSSRSTKEDWFVWLRQFSIQLLRESPSAALRACSALAQKYPPLAKELFNCAFLSCWSELFDQYQDDLMRSLEQTFQSKNIPAEVVTTLLDLAEYMETHDKALPIDISTLAELADRCHAHAKALHYRENEFALNSSNTETLESLISLNIKLQQRDAAHGILRLASKLQYEKEQQQQAMYMTQMTSSHHDTNYAIDNLSQQDQFQLKESWFERLERWEDALEAYERRQLDEPDNNDILLGRMRCLKAINQWERLSQLSTDVFDRTTDVDIRHAVAPLAASAACSLRQWQQLEDYVEAMDERQVDSAFYAAILSIHKNNYPSAYKLIDRACELVDTGLTSLMSESYSRAYPAIINVQQFIELQEVITYKQSTDERRSMIRKTWKQRLAMCERNVDVWQEILSIRSLVITAKEDIDTWLEFATLCRKSNKLHLSLKILTSLLGFSPAMYVSNQQLSLPKTYPQLTLACLKHLYTAGFQVEAHKRLQELVNNNSALQYSPNRPDGLTNDELAHLRSVAFLKLGSWQLWTLDDQWQHIQYGGGTDRGEENQRSERNKQYAAILPNVISSFHFSCTSDHNYYKAWHEFAMVNFRIVSQYKHQQPNSDSTPVGSPHRSSHMPSVEQHVIPAITGFIRSIWLQTHKQRDVTIHIQQNPHPHNTMQDVLRVLALWFEFGMKKDVDAAVLQGINTISIDTWLEVIPQLIARIYTPHKMIRMLLVDLLCRIGKAHPQSLVWALTVASKSPSDGRRRAAVAVLHEMRKYSSAHGVLVAQALLVSQELVRVAILWHELWHEAIEEASRHWFGSKNFETMWSTLAPLHKMLEEKPQTAREQQFYETYGADLRDAATLCDKYHRSKDTRYIEQAWQSYSAIFRKLAKTLSSTQELELSEVSPKLLQATDLQLCIPGSYLPNQSSVRISYFAPLLRVIESKQHPRRLLIGGSDGYEYAFLLKGHEDLRQDERCMQLFGLVNSLLEVESSRVRGTAATDLNIERYAVIPLSVWPQSGLIAWVPHVDPVHAAIKQYRDARRILLNIEQRLMMRFAPDYQSLTVIQKVEVFEHALTMTTGQDLAKVLWLRSPSADTWLERRVNFTKSLAVMSMVGYVLGLGDRHTCNLLLDRQSGKVIHIDFGDCFEVAMHRDKYPEKVPFRLTRMLVNAMEVAGIEGTYKATCEAVMKVLRKNRNSVMAVLEAFVHDPLINWRLLSDQRIKTKADAEQDENQQQQPQTNGKAKPNADQQLYDNANDNAEHGLEAKEQKPDSTQLPDPSPPTRSPKNFPAGGDPELQLLELQRQRSAGAILNNANQINVELEMQLPTESLNEKALAVIGRVESKLKGTDFAHELLTSGNNTSKPSHHHSSSHDSDLKRFLSTDQRTLDVSQQVSRLIQEATSQVNLCQAYIGWCPFW